MAIALSRVSLDCTMVCLQNKDIIEIFYKYLDKNSNNSLRQCSRCLVKIINPKYFNYIVISAKKINEDNKQSFYDFVNTSKSSINVKNICNVSQLLYFKNLNVRSVIFSDLFN